MSTDRGKLGSFLKEVISWNWVEFCMAEKDPKYLAYQAAVFSLVRTATDGKLGAIKTAIDRVDGKLETPVNVEYPKVFFIYPDATRIASPTGAAATLPSPQDTYPPSEEEITDDPEEITAATMSLRETLRKMVDAPRVTVPVILEVKKKIEKDPSAYVGKDNEDIEFKVPLVKSVIAANLLNLATEKNNFEAIMEVFDQIDGKLVETIRMLGDDLYLTQYALEAPYGSIKNKDGVYVYQAKEVEALWQRKLELKLS